MLNAGLLIAGNMAKWLDREIAIYKCPKSIGCVGAGIQTRNFAIDDLANIEGDIA